MGAQTGEDPDRDLELLLAKLVSAHEAAQLAWPHVKTFRAADFVERFARALGERMTTEELGDDRAAEVALALACCDDDRDALLAFEQTYLAPVRMGLSPMKLAPSLLDDVIQETRAKLLVADEGPPKILEYVGRGRLRGLLQVVAARIAIDELRKSGKSVPTDSQMDGQPGSPEVDPALLYLRAHAGERFRLAFRKATEQLTPHERNLLYLHHLRGVQLARLATMYRVHRATIVRQLSEIRRKLVVETERALKVERGGDSSALASLLGLLGSQLDGSVWRLLGDATVTPERGSKP